MEEIKVGSQIWAAENLDVSHFRNGILIPEAKTAKEWEKANEECRPAWCYFDNDPNNGKIYGKMYNWHAVNDPKGLAPVGWHMPSDAEWTILTDHLGGINLAGTKMKSAKGWHRNGNGTNESLFSGFPAGSRKYDGKFLDMGRFGYWWSSIENGSNQALSRALNHYYGYVNKLSLSKGNGLSVRCLRD